jgi:hypothetical protein
LRKTFNKVFSKRLLCTYFQGLLTSGVAGALRVCTLFFRAFEVFFFSKKKQLLIFFSSEMCVLTGGVAAGLHVRIQELVEGLTDFVRQVDASHGQNAAAWSDQDFEAFYTTSPQWSSLLVRDPLPFSRQKRRVTCYLFWLCVPSRDKSGMSHVARFGGACFGFTSFREGFLL